MNIIKRDGKEVRFEKGKIKAAIVKANTSMATKSWKITDKQIDEIVAKVVEYASKVNRALNVEEIQNKIEDELLELSPKLGKKYISYRYLKESMRKKNTTDGKILALVECVNEDVKQENSNKNPTICSVQRDYVAGEVSRDITERLLLGQDPVGREIVQAHRDGVIHFHDSDYYLQHMFNCCLVNMDDVLQNGTMISGVKIERPHSFQTACNIATQVIAQVASNQYGGQSVSIYHLSKFVDVSRKRYRDDLSAELGKIGSTISKEKFDEIVEDRVRKEIKDGIQLLQYQTITLQTTNGQAPFITFFMYLNEAKNAQEKHDLAMVIEEIIKQRTQGVKNEKGVWITPAFPKLIYVLQEDNIKEGTPYYYLTRLAAKCTAKRLVPDYISEKVMKQLKISARGTSDVYTCMGCRSFLTPDRSKEGGFNNIANAGNYVPGESKYYGRLAA